MRLKINLKISYIGYISTTTLIIMTVSTLIRKSEDNFKLAQAICKELAAHFNKDEEEVWGVVSPSHTVVKLTKKFKKLRKANDPLNGVKKPRTAYSFFTQDKRQAMSEANPDVSFGELSKLVAAAWKNLSDSQRAKYSKKETADKERYNTEKAEVLAELERNPPAPVQTEESTTEEAAPVEKPAKKSRAPKSKSTKTEKPAKAEKSTTTKKGKGVASKGKGHKGGNKKRATATA